MAEWCRRDNLVQESGFDAKYMSTMNSLFARDYKGSRPFTNDSAALDMDTMERDASGKNDCTMDCAIGICKYNGDAYTHEQMLLVEFRCDYKSSHNLDHTQMSKKVSHSKAMLAPSAVHNCPIFIFKDNVVNQAQSWVRNYSSQYAEMRHWQVMKVADFNAFVGVEADFPYVPVTDLTCIDRDITASAVDADALMNTYQKWRDIALKFKLKYNLREVEAITNALHQALEDIVNKGICADPDVAALAQEDLALITK